MRRCRYCTRQPDGDVDDVTVRLHALWVILTSSTTATVVDAELADDRLLGWVAAARSRRPARVRRSH